MPNPVFRIKVGSVDSAMLNDRLLSITVTDQAGSVNDSVSISLDDRDELIELPSKGDEIEVQLGYEALEGITNPFDGLKLMGTFKLDEIKCSGSPNVLTLTGHAFDTGGMFKQQRNGQFHRKTLGEIVTTIAERNELTPRIHEDLGEIAIPHIHQRAQSDGALLESLAAKVGGIAKVQAGYLYFAPLGKIEEVAQGDIITPTITVKRVDMEPWDYTDQSRSEFAKVESRYYDKDAGETERVLGEGEARFDNSMEVANDLPNETEAQLSADSRADAMKRAQESWNFTTQGNPDLMAEGRVVVEGQRSGIPDLWLITQAVHTFIDGGGYTTACSCIVAEG